MMKLSVRNGVLLWAIILASVALGFWLVSGAGAKTADVPQRQLLDGQVGYAVLDFGGQAEARTAVTFDPPIDNPIMVCSGSDEWAIEAIVSCEAKTGDFGGITAVMPYTTTHPLIVYWIAVEGN